MVVGGGSERDMNVSSSGKRKPPRPLSEDSDSDGVSPKVAAKDYAATKISCFATPESEHRELTVVLAGRTPPMKHWHPTTVNNASRAIIGDYRKVFFFNFRGSRCYLP